MHHDASLHHSITTSLVKAALCIVFECTLQYIAICNWIVVKDISYGNISISKYIRRKERLSNHINSKKLECPG